MAIQNEDEDEDLPFFVMVAIQGLLQRTREQDLRICLKMNVLIFLYYVLVPV